VLIEIFRNDWRELLGEDSNVQVNFSVTYLGIIRALHKHERGQIEFFLVIRDSIKVYIRDDEEKLSYKRALSRGSSVGRKAKDPESAGPLIWIQGHGK